MFIDEKNDVISLNTAIKLAQLGVNEYSNFYYVKGKGGDRLFGLIDGEKITFDFANEIESQYAAYSSIELSKMVSGHFNLRKEDGCWCLHFSPDQGTDNSYTFIEKNLAEALGKMLIAYHVEIQTESL